MSTLHNVSGRLEKKLLYGLTPIVFHTTFSIYSEIIKIQNSDSCFFWEVCLPAWSGAGTVTLRETGQTWCKGQSSMDSKLYTSTTFLWQTSSLGNLTVTAWSRTWTYKGLKGPNKGEVLSHISFKAVHKVSFFCPIHISSIRYGRERNGRDHSKHIYCLECFSHVILLYQYLVV